MKNPIIQEILNIKNRLNECERKLSDFSMMLNEKTQADVDFIAMEEDIDLDQNFDPEGGAE